MKQFNLFIATIVFIGLVGCESDSKSEYKPCADSEVYDASLNACRKMVCEDLGYKTCEGKDGCFKPDTIYTCGNDCVDCTSLKIEHMTEQISCQNGKCEFTCKKGYRKDDSGTKCEEICKYPLGDCNGDDICETHLDEYGLKSCSACADDYAACGETKTSDGIAIPLCLKLTPDTTDENIKEVTKTSCDVLCNYDDWQPKYETEKKCPIYKEVLCGDLVEVVNDRHLYVSADCGVDICEENHPGENLKTTTYLNYEPSILSPEDITYPIEISFIPPSDAPGYAYGYVFKVTTCKPKQKCQLNTNGYDEKNNLYLWGTYTYPFDIECVDE